MVSRPVRVLVVDDSAFMRKILSDILSGPGLEVIGTARDGQDALRKIKKLRPDVVTLDVEMPLMGGLAALEAIMADDPLPVVMVSSRTAEGADVTLQALAAGAVDFIQKPSGTISLDMERVAEELRKKVLEASLAIPRVAGLKRPIKGSPMTEPPLPRTVRRESRHFELLAVAASTGGPRALQEILPLFPARFPLPVVIVQHMPEGFTASLAQRLNGLASLNVVEAAEGLILKPGLVVIAPGGRHLAVARNQGNLVCRLSDSPPLRSVRPSADLLFLSVAEVVGPSALGLILTGMGRDGTDGARAMKARGAYILAEAPETCVVYGMPRSAVEAGVVDEQQPLGLIPGVLAQLVGIKDSYR